MFSIQIQLMPCSKSGTAVLGAPFNLRALALRVQSR